MMKGPGSSPDPNFYYRTFITGILIGEAGTVCNRFFDYDDGDFAMSISDSMAMDSDGNLMMRMGDHMAMDMDTGDIHMISSWSDDDEE